MANLAIEWHLEITRQSLESFNSRPRIHILLSEDSNDKSRLDSLVYVKKKIDLLSKLGIDVQVKLVNEGMSKDQLMETIDKCFYFCFFFIFAEKTRSYQLFSIFYFYKLASFQFWFVISFQAISFSIILNDRTINEHKFTETTYFLFERNISFN